MRATTPRGPHVGTCPGRQDKMERVTVCHGRCPPSTTVRRVSDPGQVQDVAAQGLQVSQDLGLVASILGAGRKKGASRHWTEANMMWTVVGASKHLWDQHEHHPDTAISFSVQHMHSLINTHAIIKQSNAHDKIPYPPTNPMVVVITPSRDPRNPPAKEHDPQVLLTWTQTTTTDSPLTWPPAPRPCGPSRQSF